MLTVGNFSAWVAVDDLPLQEYDIKIKDSEITCWIPSEVGKNFTVKWETRTNDCVVTDVYLDGKFAGGGIIEAGFGDSEDGISGIYTSPTSQKPFLFSRLDLTDDDAYLDTNHTQIGEIKVLFFEGVIEVIEADSVGFAPGSFKELGKVHERSKKAIDHQIGLGTEEQAPYQKTSRCRCLRTLATMIFRYRPIDILRANGLAPPAPQPPAGSQVGEKRPAPPEDAIDLTMSDDETDQDDEEEVAALEARLAAIRNKRRRMKVKSEPGVKTEPGSASIRKERKRGQVAQPSDVIDLT
ncbi:hypothetical protein K435DRAFT_841704 [Dendrothele bispora CBS 962.96]|uniref:DUF7918 domain-containing protein n=1 Tax=Dendrothele bispora (strain CBS 962.96) TaxID=1314807 RepID=A0A4S8LLA1_DENBC|nr:hypothetical protein K435DRAFT_841704 [Dendrothele bispora CBS 962.96]